MQTNGSCAMMARSSLLRLLPRLSMSHAVMFRTKNGTQQKHQNKERIHRMTLSTCQWLVGGVQDWMTSKTKRLTHLGSQSLRQCSGQGCCGFSWFSFQAPWKPLKDGLAKSLAVYISSKAMKQTTWKLHISQALLYLRTKSSGTFSENDENAVQEERIRRMIFSLILVDTLQFTMSSTRWAWIEDLERKTNGLEFGDDFLQCLQISC